VTHLTTLAFLYRRHHPEDGQITGRNMLVNISEININHKIKVHFLVAYTYYKPD